MTRIDPRTVLAHHAKLLADQVSGLRRKKGDALEAGLMMRQIAVVWNAAYDEHGAAAVELHTAYRDAKQLVYRLAETEAAAAASDIVADARRTSTWTGSWKTQAAQLRSRLYALPLEAGALGRYADELNTVIDARFATLPRRNTGN
jgi:hypothetical protein